MLKNLYNEIKNYQPYDEEEKEQQQIMLNFIEKNDDALLRENKIAHFTTSAWIINKERTKVLMIYHNIYKSWAWVGGHADGDENLLNVIKKEISEETGVTDLNQLSDGIYGLNIVNVDNHYKRGNYVPDHLHLDVEYLFETSESNTIRIKEDENSDVKWIKLDEVNDYTTEEKMKPIYDKLTKKLTRIKK